MSERDNMTGHDERSRQVNATRQLGGERHDANAGPRALDDLEDLGTGKRPRDRSAVFVRNAQALDWLCPPIFGVDEVALEMRRQHARRTRGTHRTYRTLRTHRTLRT